MASAAGDNDNAVDPLARLQGPHPLTRTPLPFWNSEFRWMFYPLHFELESDVKAIWEMISFEYVRHYDRSLLFRREDEKIGSQFSQKDPTKSDFTVYTRKRSASALVPPELIPLSVIENKIGLGSLKENQDAVGQVVRAMLERLWTGTPVYEPETDRLRTDKSVAMAKHSPMFGISACGQRFRRIIVLNASVGYIDISEAGQAVTYSDTEWAHLTSRDGRCYLDLHFHLMDSYSRYIASLPQEEGIKAYGDLASVPEGDRTLIDGHTTAVMSNPGEHGMQLFDPSSFANSQKGRPAATPSKRPGEGAAGDRDGSATQGGDEPATEGDDKNRDRPAPEGGDENSGSSKRRRSTRNTGRAVDQAITSAPSKGAVHAGPSTLTNSCETDGSSNPSSTSSDDGAMVSSDGASKLADVIMHDSGEDLSKLYSEPMQHSATTSVEATSDVSSEQYQSDRGTSALVEEEAARIHAILRPMSSMTYQHRQAIFGVVGEGWEEFAAAYIGCPVSVEAASDVSSAQCQSDRGKSPLTEEEAARTPATLRPMSSMSYRDRQAIFGVVGEGWEEFAAAYIGCPSKPS